jgi:hypothetical protein
MMRSYERRLRALEACRRRAMNKPVSRPAEPEDLYSRISRAMFPGGLASPGSAGYLERLTEGTTTDADDALLDQLPADVVAELATYGLTARTYMAALGRALDEF